MQRLLLCRQFPQHAIMVGGGGGTIPKILEPVRCWRAFPVHGSKIPWNDLKNVGTIQSQSQTSAVGSEPIAPLVKEIKSVAGGLQIQTRGSGVLGVSLELA